MNFKDYTSKEIITLISALIGATGAIFAAIVGISIHNQIVECRLEVNNCINTVNTINTNISSLNSITNTNATYFTEAEKTPTTLFNEAIHAYNTGDYEQVYKIYSEEKICFSPVALTNLGYLYENGYGVVQDFDKADDYFIAAIDQGYEPAFNRKLAMFLKYSLPGVEEVIYEGYNRNSEVTAKFISSFYPQSNKTPKQLLQEFCTGYTQNEQLNFLNKNIWYWEDAGYIGFDVPPISSNTVQYELANLIINPDALSVTKLYHRFNKKPYNIHLIDDGFIYSHDL